MNITYSRTGHDLGAFARDFYDAFGMSQRRYLITDNEGNFVGLAWTQGGAKRLAKRVERRTERYNARVESAAVNSKVVASW